MLVALPPPNPAALLYNGDISGEYGLLLRGGGLNNLGSETLAYLSHDHKPILA
jgi:hypothetical protein